MGVSAQSAPNKKKAWESDLLTDRFNTHKPMDEIHPDAAVNIYVGWPALFEQIKYQSEFLGVKSCNILDFGCGAGNFCKQLHIMGHKVTGIDHSEALLEIARAHSPTEITFINNSILDDKNALLHLENRMDVITSIHSFDWIEDTKIVVSTLATFMKKDGIFLFTIFPKSHVRDSIKINDLFENFDSAENPTKGFANFDGVKVPAFIRDPAYYDEVFEGLGFEKLLEFYPPFPKSFFDRYKWQGSKKPEMLILGYKKS
ncbi:MAG: hypothetical protein UU64_C0021G0004 [candidate division WWE3 bacterium GW2011_GWF2_41_45]|uniref:Methyltransferase domain-containing protein n=3 Tax=Katanobacteria TaxID=422282 RepID=A0A1F4W098_UNCKA|nr:MAG: hypothetical protein UU55_C0005G0089 [candidate division WWE3 bacterium GW2011_GWC2_41_23]KKS08757.1 MAG: hypothetical protein UU64_C0021G0004 [candidate division WWE3 bacterium GW2011_GWF2_41_45]KKS11796.1 MAG: hypothetical protein UU68_C0011G0009 [candidate division WWE3 bacterium GW2011_GWF1_41_53]KKS19412.1 MAG: hypothetical protein UU79_C0020G0009 [candidate division WWE3 bacterium GW2011_GWE1_41_72]KKS30090.1 MAG: hypothetical protein UU90_C0005G0050 [candidate division WWE3 bacte